VFNLAQNYTATAYLSYDEIGRNLIIYSGKYNKNFTAMRTLNLIYSSDTLQFGLFTAEIKRT
jgi:hypothetical protein